MSLDMLLQVLRTLEGLAAKVTFMRLQRHVDSNVGGDVIPLHSRSPTVTPSTGEIQVVGTLSPNMAFTHMFLQFSQPREP